jgi:hypothetical protein
MTLVLSCLTPDYVALVADRRLVVAGDSPGAAVPIDDDACKVVLLGDRFAFGYSGLAEMEHPPAGRTDLWLVDRLQRMSPTVDSIPALFARLAVDANDAFRRITDIDVSREPQFFVAVGFESDGGNMTPVFLSLSNAQDANGRRREASNEWVLWCERLGDAPMRLLETGERLDIQARDDLEMVLPEIAHDNPAGVVDLLGQAIRAVHKHGNSAVGESLLAV